MKYAYTKFRSIKFTIHYNQEFKLKNKKPAIIILLIKKEKAKQLKQL